MRGPSERTQQGAQAARGREACMLGIGHALMGCAPAKLTMALLPAAAAGRLRLTKPWSAVGGGAAAVRRAHPLGAAPHRCRSPAPPPGDGRVGLKADVAAVHAGQVFWAHAHVLCKDLHHIRCRDCQLRKRPLRQLRLFGLCRGGGVPQHLGIPQHNVDAGAVGLQGVEDALVDQPAGYLRARVWRPSCAFGMSTLCGMGHRPGRGHRGGAMGCLPAGPDPPAPRPLAPPTRSLPRRQITMDTSLPPTPPIPHPCPTCTSTR